MYKGKASTSSQHSKTAEQKIRMLIQIEISMVPFGL